ncbi:MAG: DUF5011 domain-containing protein [Bacilli bacterium]|nr:DUF5011 domain-containing protein [Bacilli bacterium]MDD4808488.1 DUF5011 domain-containing protein [Bacilli bacterium]
MKKGFTMVELLGVIVILALLALIAIPAIEKQIKSGTEKLYDIQVKTIEAALKDWKSDHLMIVPKYQNNTLTITLYQLKQDGKIDPNIINPKTNQLFPDDMLLRIKKVDKTFEYEIDLNSGSNLNVFDNDNSPKIELIGDELIYLNKGESFVDPGVIATNASGGVINDITEQISGPDSVVNPTLSGEYMIKYSVSDNELTAMIIRTVIVVD